MRRLPQRSRRVPARTHTVPLRAALLNVRELLAAFEVFLFAAALIFLTAGVAVPSLLPGVLVALGLDQHRRTKPEAGRHDESSV